MWRLKLTYNDNKLLLLPQKSLVFKLILVVRMVNIKYMSVSVCKWSNILSPTFKKFV